MASNQSLGLGVVLVVAVIVAGYVVSCLVSAKHYPRTAGVLAANALMGAFALAGAQAAAYIVVWLVVFSLPVVGHALEADNKDRNSN